MEQENPEQIYYDDEPEQKTKGAYTSPIDRYGSQISVLTNPNDDLYRFELFLRCLQESQDGELVKIGSKKIVRFNNLIEIQDELILRNEHNTTEHRISLNTTFGKKVKDAMAKKKYVDLEVTDWKPLMNDLGINSVLLSMQGILNSMTPLSNLDDREIGVLIEHLGWDLVDNLTFNKVRFGVDDVNRRVIAGAAIRFCYIFLKRPYQEGDKKFFKGITQEVKHTSEIKKPSGFSLNPFSILKK